MTGRREPRQQMIRRPSLETIYPAIGVVAVVVIWHGLSIVGRLPPRLLPAPSLVIETIVDRSAFYLAHSWSTLQATGLSFGLSAVVGVLIGSLIASSKLFERTLYPLVIGSQVIPKIAIGPAILIWFGFGIGAKAGVGFLIAFFPVVIGTVVGLRQVQPEKMYLIRSMGAGAVRSFFMVKLPSALPEVFAGLKMAMAFSVTGVVIGEFIGSEAGLGRAIKGAAGVYDTLTVFGALTLLSVLGVTLFLLVAMVERFVLRWHIMARE